ncbi:hypothetical protein [Desulfobacca acetoxidans]|uniref:Uncharacterized protein n=1 Tax=Desulfobacca acetoxidans (strain ATCC 700848 / DSM 11109 / ASRB2) TaxID=880072 RepID=F2NDJ4_DESAR|nr:hypothetical protein [Desulfobacca acetoxidans]AEB10270.1 hypothetical protein Desac_2449 [Desulfobacca acetoxidans DSM 11109]
MEPLIDDLLHKVKVISQTSYGTMLNKIIDSVYEKVEEEYDTEPLNPEELQVLEEVVAAVKRGDLSRFISLEEFEKKHGL